MPRKALALVLLSASLLTAGCDAGGKRDASPVVATVDGSPITSDELNRELALRARKDPTFRVTADSVREQLDVLVNRRLLIREAQDRKLTEDARFTQTIQTFWEQTLIRLLMDRVAGELRAASEPTAEEVNGYYSKLSERVTLRVFSSRDAAAVVEAARQLEAGTEVRWQRTLAGVRWDDIRSAPFEEAFALAPGQARIFREGETSLLIQLVSREPNTPPALEEIRPRIAARIKERKERRAFDAWLAARREAADVELAPEKFEAKP